MKRVRCKECGKLVQVYTDKASHGLWIECECKQTSIGIPKRIREWI